MSFGDLSVNYRTQAMTDDISRNRVVIQSVETGRKEVAVSGREGSVEGARYLIHYLLLLFYDMFGQVFLKHGKVNQSCFVVADGHSLFEPS